MTVLKFMKPFEEQPEPGQLVKVFLTDGRERKASCCKITDKYNSYIQWYDLRTRKAIDVNKIKGWISITETEFLER